MMATTYPCTVSMSTSTPTIEARLVQQEGELQPTLEPAYRAIEKEIVADCWRAGLLPEGREEGILRAAGLVVRNW